MKTLLLTLFILVNFGFIYCQQWIPVGNAIDMNVYDMIKFDNKLYAGWKYGIMAWDGSTWTNIPEPFGIDCPLSFSTLNDNLYTSGDFPYQSTSTKVFKFDGANWSQIGGDFQTSTWASVKKVHTHDTLIIAGGKFSTIGGQPRLNVAKWDGNSWTAMGAGLNNMVFNFESYNGDLFATGSFTESGTDTLVHKIGKWNGNSWVPFDSSVVFNSPGAMIEFNGNLIIGGVWETINGVPMKGITKWDGMNYTSMGNPLIKSVNSFWTFNNELYLSGTLFTLNPNASKYVVLKLLGTIWQEVGSGFDEEIFTLEDFNNQLYCGGQFSSPTENIARYDQFANTEELSTNVEFVLAPNPSTNQFKIFGLNNIQGKATVKIISLAGELIYNYTDVDEETILSIQNKGLFFVQIYSDNVLKETLKISII